MKLTRVCGEAVIVGKGGNALEQAEGVGPGHKAYSVCFRRAVRRQMEWRLLSLDQLLPEEHSAHLVWASVETLDLSEVERMAGAVAHVGRSKMETAKIEKNRVQRKNSQPECGPLLLVGNSGRLDDRSPARCPHSGPCFAGFAHTAVAHVTSAAGVRGDRLIIERGASESGRHLFVDSLQ